MYPVGYGCSETVEPWPDCYPKAVGGWYDGGYLLLPKTIAHEAPVMLVTGGETGRRKTPSWASWRQLWPRTGAHEGTGTRANGGGPAFDVSDVDVTNFTEIDCRDEVSAGCDWWKDFPDMGIAGAHGGGIGYFQIKNPPTDEAELKVLKYRLMPCHDVIGNCTYTDDSGQTWTRTNRSTTTVEIISVKHDYRELWRWATVLKRFAVSAGNTMGIVDAQVLSNVYSDGLYVHGVAWAGASGVMASGAAHPAHVRETIAVHARDLQRVADGLPALLPLLGIPVDAVGRVSLPWD